MSVTSFAAVGSSELPTDGDATPGWVKALVVVGYNR